MFKKVQTIFLLFLLDPICCQVAPNETRPHDFTVQYLFMFGSLLLVALIRHLVREYEVPIPYSFFCIWMGIFWGIGALYIDWMKPMAKLRTASITTFAYIYIPASIFSVSFGIDVHSFLKSLPQILIISGPVAVITCMFIGFSMRLVINPEWVVADAILLGALLVAIYPTEVVQSLRASTSNTKRITILLEGETLITASWIFSFLRFAEGYVDGWIVRWYQFVMGAVRLFVLGIPMGYIFGSFGAALMQVAYNDQLGLMIITVGMCYTGYYFTLWLSMSGIMGVTVMGIVMGLKRGSLPSEIDTSLVYLWRTLTTMLNGVLYVFAGVVTPSFLQGVHYKDWVVVLVSYLVLNITRFICFLMFLPVLSRTGYGMSATNMVICIWSGLKNPYSLLMALRVLGSAYGAQEYKAKLIFLHTIGVYMLVTLINGSSLMILLQALGLSNVSPARQFHMNSCIKHINEARSRTGTILKMDRFLADANWALVMSCTTLQHPYKKTLQKMLHSDQVGEEDDFLTAKYTFCPDCHKDVPNEPTPKEFQEMTKEAKLRLLKLKKTAYTRQFENGMVCMQGIRILHQFVEVAADSEELVIELDGLFKLFTREGIFYRFCRNRLINFIETKSEGLRPPRLQSRLWCYRIVNHDAFAIFMHLVVVTNMLFLIIHTVHDEWFKEVFYGISLFVRFVYLILYLIEFTLKIFAYSWIYIFKHGFHRYFRSFWCWVEFIILCLSFMATAAYIVRPIIDKTGTSKYIDVVLDVALLIRSLHVLTILRHCTFCMNAVPSMIKYLDVKTYRHRALAFELGKNYISAGEEILENLHQIIDNEKIRNVVKQRLENDRLAVTRRLGLAQKESPSVAINVKTKLAMRMVLNSMKEDVNELKVSGWVDDIEYGKLLKTLIERRKFINSIKIIPAPSSKRILKGVPYMGDDGKIIDFVYSQVVTKRFDPGDVVYKEGDVAEAIYILTSGMFTVTYTPKSEVLNRLLESGMLPIVDYICSMSYDEVLTEYVLPGNTIGELSLLTGRPYDATVTSTTHSQIYVIKRAVLAQAFQMDPDPVDGFMCRIWKYISFKKAIIVMTTIPSYRSLTQEKMKYVLERSFVPNLSNYKIFVVNNMISDIILIEGVVVDFNNKDVYTGPCYIPRAVQKLVFPQSSTISLESSVETRLLIIPAKGFDEYEIMVTEEEICELVKSESELCVRHIIQDQGLRDVKKARGPKHMKAIIGEFRRRKSSAVVGEFEPPSMMPTPRGSSKMPSDSSFHEQNVGVELAKRLSTIPTSRLQPESPGRLMKQPSSKSVSKVQLNVRLSK